MSAQQSNPAPDPHKLQTLPLGPLNEEFVGFSEKGLFPNSADEIDVNAVFSMAVAQKASDVHLRVGYSPIVRKDGKILHTRLPELTPSAMQRFARWLIPDALKPFVAKRHDVDFSLDFENARLRVNLLYERSSLAFSIRVIPASIPDLEELGLPKSLLQFTTMDHGLILITGSAGSGKSTSLASILSYINRNHSKHIVTLEDPIEFIHKNSTAMVTQRQLGIDTPSFPAGIKHALRQDPDVLLIGEMRDRETAMSAIKAAETGALVFSTLHTADALQTISRIIDFFEPHEREAIRVQLANVLRGIVCQRLFHKMDGVGMSAVAEVLMVTSTVRDYLLKNQLDEITALMDEGRFDGMQTMNYVLYQLIMNQKISVEEAIRVSNNGLALKQRLKGAYHGTTIGG